MRKKILEQTDPVCGMAIDPARVQHESTYRDETYYFCSKKCKDTFDANPEEYAESDEPEE